ncbi:MAG TPA: trypsin-like serine protease [Polyangiaceae bacterium]|nr:trypsin-like serine protease [Polyangiaceae bacterium]
MSKKLSLRTGKIGTAVVRLALASGVALTAGCAVGSEASESGSSDSVATQEQALIGGTAAAPYHFRSTVAIGGVCTAAKVGARLFLTAAHCVAVPRPGRGQPVPEPFPPNNGVADKYLPGKSLLINWGLNVNDADQGQFTIVRTRIHPSWWSCPLCQDPILSQGGAADIAVIEIAQDTSQIPQARVQLTPVQTGTQAVKVGWGCEDRTNQAVTQLTRYKTDDAWTIPAAQIRHHDSPITDQQIATVGASYLITAGRDQNPDNASLCLGDSGGPLYLPNNSDPRVVGVNSNYTFRPISDPNDLGGVSWTDWHTKTSLDSLHGVGQWLVNEGVNTVGGTANPNCSCPSGCNAVQSASVPLTLQGQRDTCYFFPRLGYSVNSHSMAQVNLNGTNITNQWLGNWSYPAKRDGGYYLYVKGQQSWSWLQAAN